jgi:mevalonate kinase
MTDAFAKILLFGEHIVLQGAEALAIPWTAFQGNWAWQADQTLQQSLPAFCRHLQQLQAQEQLLAPLDLKQFAKDLERGLYFASDIPTGYGAGSSGALCAALYKRYQTQAAPDDLVVLRAQLAQLESFFHGSSSGTDPLICYLNQAIHIIPGQGIRAFDWNWPNDPDVHFFVIDTGIKRQTGPWVEAFKAKAETPDFRQKMQTQLILHSNQAIYALLQAESLPLLENFRQISQFHYAELQDWIPAPFHQIWKRGLDGGDYLLKICGAGGGGFILGLSQDAEVIPHLEANYKVLSVR